jgi:hypothetical protein
MAKTISRRERAIGVMIAVSLDRAAREKRMAATRRSMKASWRGSPVSGCWQRRK